MSAGLSSPSVHWESAAQKEHSTDWRGVRVPIVAFFQTIEVLRLPLVTLSCTAAAREEGACDAHWPDDDSQPCRRVQNVALYLAGRLHGDIHRAIVHRATMPTHPRADPRA